MNNRSFYFYYNKTMTFVFDFVINACEVNLLMVAGEKLLGENAIVSGLPTTPF